MQIRYEGREFGSIAVEVAVDGDAADHHDLIAPDGIELVAVAVGRASHAGSSSRVGSFSLFAAYSAVIALAGMRVAATRDA